MSVRITVLIATHRRPELLADTLASLAACELPDGYREMIVVESGARDGAEALVAACHPPLRARYIHVAEPGKSRALNRGIQEIGDDLVVFFDDDVRVSSKTLIAYEEAAGMLGRRFYFGGRIHTRYQAPPDPAIVPFLPRSAGGNRVVPNLPNAMLTLVFVGFNWAAYAADIRLAGGFDTRFGIGSPTGATGEETSMQRQLCAAGLMPFFVSDASVEHYVPRERCSMQWALRRSFRIGIESGLYSRTSLTAVLRDGPRLAGKFLGLFDRLARYPRRTRHHGGHGTRRRNLLASVSTVVEISIPMVDGFLNDLRHALRSLIKARAFTLAAVAALTLGIGANTAIFSVVNAVLLRPVAAPDADRIVFFMNTSPQGSDPGASPAKFVHWRAQSDVVRDVTALGNNVINYTSGSGMPEQVRAGVVSADFFRLFGAPIFRGRTFTEEEDRPKGAKAVVLGYGLWTRRFGSDESIVGRSITLGSEPYTVVGILGPGFDLESIGDTSELWIPFQIDPNSTDQGHYFRALGRLKPGVTLDQAKAQIQLSAQDFIARFPNALAPNGGFSVERVQEVLVRNVRSTLLILAGAVSFVLLIACANVANLLLVRASGRRREIAVRAAIGAGRGRIVRQLLTESLVLSLAGGAFGFVLGVAGIRALLSINTANLPRVGEGGALVAVDWRVVTFAIVVSIVTGVVFGLIPALHASRADLSSTLKESAGRSGTGFRQNKARALLVVAEVALALILLVGSALLIRTSLALSAVDPGFDAGHVLTMRMSLQDPKYREADGVERLVRDGVERLRTIPGVEQASAACCVPLEGGYGLGFVIQGRPTTTTPFHGGGGWLTVSPGYFEVFKIAMKRGRSFVERDDKLAPPVVIINEAFARRYFKDSDPLNERLVIGHAGNVGMREFMTEPPRQIIGVASDVRDGGLNRDPNPTMYIPQAQMPDAANALNVRITPMAWVVRTRGAPYSVSAAVQEQLREVSGLPVSSVRSMEDVVSRSISRQRFNMLLMTVFGGSALLLAAIGIYGLMAYSVEQRTQEIGIRLALGATTGDVRRMIVRQGMLLAVIGIVVGLGSAFGLARVIANLLYGVTARDPMVFTGVAAVLGIVALVGVWLPTRSAVRVDPVIALRAE